MKHAQVRRVAVWGGTVRLTHWIIAATTLLLLVTGIVLTRGFSGNLEPVISLHLTAGYLLALAVAVRVYLLFFGRDAAHWRDCIPSRAHWRLAVETLRYYLSWTRTPMPSYFGHNPLWGPVYLAVFVLLAIQCVTGVLIRASYGAALSSLPATAPIPALHGVLAGVIAVFCVLHVIAVFLHDWKGTGSEVSAMISGYKIFVISPPPLDLAARIKPSTPPRADD